jgi:hypothetical protein
MVDGDDNAANARLPGVLLISRSHSAPSRMIPIMISKILLEITIGFYYNGNEVQWPMRRPDESLCMISIPCHGFIFMVIAHHDEQKKSKNYRTQNTSFFGYRCDQYVTIMNHES